MIFFNHLTNKLLIYQWSENHLVNFQPWILPLQHSHWVTQSFLSAHVPYDLNGSNKLKSAAIEFHQERFALIFQVSKCSEFNEILYYYNKLTILVWVIA